MHNFRAFVVYICKCIYDLGGSKGAVPPLCKKFFTFGELKIILRMIYRQDFFWCNILFCHVCDILV